MKSNSFTFAPLALFLVSCAANHPAANVPSATGSGTHASSGTRSANSSRSSHGGGDSALSSNAASAAGNRNATSTRGAHGAQGGDFAHDGGSGQAGAQQKGSAVLGTWSGNDGQQKISVKFGANGSLLINNAAGANPGQWSGGSGGRFRIQVGGYNGEFVMVNSKTGSLTLGDSSVELKR